MELIHFECYVHVNAIVWRLIYRELRAVTNANTLNLNPLELNDLYDNLWDVGELLLGDDALQILEEGWRPWPRVKEGSEASWDFYDILDRHKARDLEILKRYRARADVEQYTSMLNTVLALFGEAIKESLTRTMADYLEATGGRLRNANKTEFEKAIASRMICTNNPAEGPFATARAFLHMYPTLKLRTLATLSAAIVNGTYTPLRKKGKQVVQAGFGLRADPALRNVIGILCGVRRRHPGLITLYMRDSVRADEIEAAAIRIARKKAEREKKARAKANKMAEYDMANTTTFANTQQELDNEIESYGNAKGYVLKYLQEQFKSRKLLRNGLYETIHITSKFRSTPCPTYL